MFSFVNISVDPSLIRGISATPSWDTFLVLIFIFGVVTYSFFVNRERLAVVLLAVYSSFAIVISAPVITNALATLAHDDVYKYRLGAFFIAFVVLYVLLSHHLTLRAEIGHTWWQAFLLSFFQVGLFLSTVLLLIPRTVFDSDFSSLYLTGDIARSFWMIAPVAAMIIMKRHSPDQRSHLNS